MSVRAKQWIVTILFIAGSYQLGAQEGWLIGFCFFLAFILISIIAFALVGYQTKTEEEIKRLSELLEQQAERNNHLFHDHASHINKLILESQAKDRSESGEWVN